MDGYGYQWMDCDATGNNCQAITGATYQTYTLQASDVGSTIIVVEEAWNNAAGFGYPAVSAPTTVVNAPTPTPHTDANTDADADTNADANTPADADADEASQHRAARDQGHREGQQEANRDPGELERHGTDDVQVPVGHL